MTRRPRLWPTGAAAAAIGAVFAVVALARRWPWSGGDAPPGGLAPAAPACPRRPAVVARARTREVVATPSPGDPTWRWRTTPSGAKVTDCTGRSFAPPEPPRLALVAAPELELESSNAAGDGAASTRRTFPSLGVELRAVAGERHVWATRLDDPGRPPRRVELRDAGELYDAREVRAELATWAETPARLWIPIASDDRIWVLGADLLLTTSVRLEGGPAAAVADAAGRAVWVRFAGDARLLARIDVATGRVARATAPFDVGALAPSPDGERVVARAASGARLCWWDSTQIECGDARELPAHATVWAEW
ncbi:MAG: hypothetical protein IT376_22005 [Polyangiaceae bacterium]|nr:hypothetical protein [Polyangiaceae bacterium]